MTEQTPEQERDSEVQEGDSEDLDLGNQETEYIKKNRDPDDVETREHPGRD